MLSFSPTGKAEVKIARITFLKKQKVWHSSHKEALRHPYLLLSFKTISIHAMQQ